MLVAAAAEHGVYIVGGSIPERESGSERLFNSSVVVDPKGTILAVHRKVHLFDIDVPGKIRFKESETLTAGSEVTVVETKWGKIGVGICYDIRFPELAQLMAGRGARILCYPGAFNTTTGPAHWELLQRAR